MLPSTSETNLFLDNISCLYDSRVTPLIHLGKTQNQGAAFEL